MKKLISLSIITLLNICFFSEILTLPRDNQSQQAPKVQIMERDWNPNPDGARELLQGVERLIASNTSLQRQVNSQQTLNASLRGEVTELESTVAQKDVLIREINKGRCYCSMPIIREAASICRDDMCCRGSNLHTPQAMACHRNCLVSGIATETCCLGVAIGVIL